MAEIAEGYSQNINMLKMAKALSDSGNTEALAQSAKTVDELKMELSNTSKSVRREALELKKLEVPFYLREAGQLKLSFKSLSFFLL